MISEGSCDTEDWSNDAKNSASHHRNKLHFKIDSNRKHFLIIIIFHNIAVVLLKYSQHKRLSKTLKIILILNF